MSNTLTAVWQQVESLLQQGLSLIPVRDKPSISNGKELPAKTPYRGWKEYQAKKITVAELWHQMAEQFDTTAVAIIGGKVSGNLEIIDIDVKNWPGIDAKLFSDLLMLYPDLWHRLRIHKSPSGGYHILYKILEGIVPGNKKLARKEGVKEAAIETRGEGGYVLAPPSLNYSVFQDNEIPTITWEERCSIIAICESYNEVVKVIPDYKPTQAAERYYSVNPFEDFNMSTEGESVLANNGWKENGRSNRFIWFTRPDKSNGVSASFNLQKRVFYIFTSSTEFDPEKGYMPATALAILQFGGDKKKTFAHLSSKGYGKVKDNIEKQIVNRNARAGKPLPANFSDEAKQAAEQLGAELKGLHPFDVFWFEDEDDDDKLSISRTMLTHVASCLGFRYYAGNVVRIIGKFIYKIDERQFQDILKEYIKEPNLIDLIKIYDCFESFLQRNGAFTMRRLPILPAEQILKDTQHICFKYFLNGYLSITGSSIDFLEYDTLEALIWADKVQQRNYTKFDGGKYIDYLNKSLVEPVAAAPIIGYLSHEYKDETTGYIIVLTEQCADPKNGGGSGKNVFCNLLSKTTSYTSKPGVQAKFDEKFFQSWNGQRIFGISDVPKNFDFSFLKEPSTGSFIWKKLFKDEIEVSVEDAPKFIVQTNFSYEISDGGLKRRIIPIEFTDFFTKCGGLDVHYNCHFPNGWNAEDWGGFDTYIATCIQQWILSGRKLSAIPLTATGWDKQFEHTYGATITGFIKDNWEYFTRIVEVPNDEFKKQLEAYYIDNNVQRNYQPSTRKINEALTAYCIKNGIEYKSDQMKKRGLDVFKCRQFLGKTPF